MGEEHDPKSPNYGIFGFYPSGKPISEHPSSEEINENWDFWYQRASEEDQEVLQAMYDIDSARGLSHLSDAHDMEEAITLCLDWWVKYYPDEYKVFMEYVANSRAILANRGFSTDKAKSWFWQGSMPDRVKNMLLLFDPEFFRRDESGRSRGTELFYKVFSRARIGGV